MEQKKASFENDYDAGCHPRYECARGTNDVGRPVTALTQRVGKSLIARVRARRRTSTLWLPRRTSSRCGALAQGVLSATQAISMHEAGAIAWTQGAHCPVRRKTYAAIDHYCKTIANPTAEHMVQPGMIYLSSDRAGPCTTGLL